MNYSSFTKSELKKALKKLDIQTTDNQSKDELIRLLNLANASVKKYKRPKLNTNTKKYSVLFLFLIGIVVLGFSIFGPQKVSTEIENNEPLIFEKNNQTYVVYNHPMVDLKIITDENCKRIECDLDNNLAKIKNSITPLFKSEIIDYRSRKGQNLIEELDIKLLPAYIFDDTILSLYDFEEKKDYFTKVKDNFLVYLTPFKSIKSPDFVNSQMLTDTQNNEAPLKIAVFMSPSSPQSKDALNVVEELKNKYPNSANVAIKHFKTNESDFLASVALECFAKENKFLEGLEEVFVRQETLLVGRDVNTRNMLASVASKLRIKSSDFLKCFDDESVKSLVESQYKEAELLGVFGVPTFFVNNNLILGSYNFEEFAKIISQIIEDENIDLNITQTTDEEI